ncbi:MAG: 4Fe-4S binding protein, partial [Clostridia bacterium]|nr:4Fe-4S binding protein [Clostridia bacterium]
MRLDTIRIDEEKCVGCNQCISVCPLEGANIAVYDGKTTKVKIDQTKCIHCGNCLQVCSHHAREYRDDSDEILNYIRGGGAYCVAVAPSLRTNFKDNWDRIISTFRENGDKGIFDVSLGADICTWAHVRYIQKHGTRG